MLGTWIVIPIVAVVLFVIFSLVCKYSYRKPIIISSSEDSAPVVITTTTQHPPGTIFQPGQTTAAPGPYPVNQSNVPGYAPYPMEQPPPAGFHSMPQPGYPPYPTGGGQMPPYPPANIAPYPMTNTMPHPAGSHMGPPNHMNPPSYDQVLNAEQYQKQAPYNPGYGGTQ